jgi:replication-associated recombination protein RarA
MNTEVNDNAIDEIVATCNGDIRGALKALMLVNERLESELRQLYAVVGGIGSVKRGTSALH